MREKRFVRFKVSTQGLLTLMKMLTMENVKLVLPFPHDAEPVAVYYDFERDLFWIKIYHPSFDIVKEGELIPEGEELVFSKVYT